MGNRSWWAVFSWPKSTGLRGLYDHIDGRSSSNIPEIVLSTGRTPLLETASERPLNLCGTLPEVQAASHWTGAQMVTLIA